MKFPSLQLIYRNAGLTLKRFPMTLMAAAGASTIGMIIPQSGLSVYENRLWLLLMMFAIAIPFSFALTSFNERRKTSTTVRLVSTLLLILLSALFYITSLGLTQDNQIIRFLLFNIAAILLVSFSPCIGKGNINGFWQYNRFLLLRFLLATFFSLVLYLGIMVAIFALNQLFKTSINIFEEIWFLTIGIFHTWFFLSGLTSDYDELDHNTDYPRGLKIFTQYVLLPLLSIYLLILYAYLLKIIFTRHFPEGWVSNLVLGFSITGIFALLLIYPLQEQAGNRWIKMFARWFFLTLIPPVLLLFLSIMRRIGDYGFTENRYFVLLISLWLGGISIYFAFRKFRNILIIPVSLCIITLLTSIGPWGAFSVSEKSQQKRLITELNKNHLMKDGKTIRVSASLPDSSSKQISSIVEYLAQFHGVTSLQPYFKESIDSLTKAAHNDNETQAVAEAVHQLIGIPYVNKRDRAFKDEDGYLNLSFKPAVQTAIPITGFEYDLPLTMSHWGNDTTQSMSEGKHIFPASDDTFHVWLGANGKIIFSSAKSKALEVNLAPLVSSLEALNAAQLNDETMHIDHENELYEVRFVFTRLTVRKKNQELIIREIMAELLVKRKN